MAQELGVTTVPSPGVEWTGYSTTTAAARWDVEGGFRWTATRRRAGDRFEEDENLN
jgi:hypothetical protein